MNQVATILSFIFRSCLNFISELFESYFEQIFFVVLQGIAGYFQKIRKKRCQNRLKEAEMNIAIIELFSNKIQTASQQIFDVCKGAMRASQPSKYQKDAKIKPKVRLSE